jgi:hypothetical protein
MSFYKHKLENDLKKVIKTLSDSIYTHKEVHEWYKIFLLEKPICQKCNKEVDYFGPWYDPERGCTRHLCAICHGEIEIRAFLDYEPPEDLKYYITMPLTSNIDIHKWLGPFFTENISDVKEDDRHYRREIIEVVGNSFKTG